ncbi:hypothetical protein D9M68_612160 [compost metagenome]
MIARLPMMASYLPASRPPMMPSQAVVTGMGRTPMRWARLSPISTSKPCSLPSRSMKLNGGYLPVRANFSSPFCFRVSRSPAWAASEAMQEVASRMPAARVRIVLIIGMVPGWLWGGATDRRSVSIGSQWRQSMLFFNHLSRFCKHLADFPGISRASRLAIGFAARDR